MLIQAKSDAVKMLNILLLLVIFKEKNIKACIKIISSLHYGCYLTTVINGETPEFNKLFYLQKYLYF